MLQMSSALLFLACVSSASAFMAPCTLPLTAPQISRAGSARCSVQLRQSKEPLIRAPSLFKKVGGVGAVDSCVEEFYDRLMDDEELESAWVDHVDYEALKESRFNLMRIAFTKKLPRGNGKIMDVHAGLKAEHFDTIMDHMKDAFEFLGVEDDVIQEAMDNVKPLQEQFPK